MPTLESTPWFAVPPCSVVLGRDGRPRWIQHVAAGTVTMTDGQAYQIDPMATVAVVVPTFEDALGILAHAFPGLEIVE